jgi:hypothetical protein
MMIMRFKRLAAMGGILLSFLSFQTPLHSIWGPSQTISNPAIFQNFDYQGVLVANPQGNAISVWVDAFSTAYPFPPSDTVSAISGAFFQRNVGWLPPQNISSLEESEFGGPLFAFNGDPDVAMNSTNYAVVVWESILINEASPNIVAAAVRDPVTGIWGPSVVLSNNSDDSNILAENTNVSLNEAGTALASWRNLNENNDFMFCSASFLPLGGTWTTPVNFAAFTTNSNDGKATPYINQSGNAVVTWQGRDANNNYNIQVVTFNAVTNTWSSVTTLDTDTTANIISQDPRCKMDPNGNAVVVWQNEGAVNTSFFNGLTWGPVVTIGTCIPQSDEDGPDMAVDLMGNFTVTWTDLNNNIATSFRLPNGSWSAPQIISTPGTINVFDPFQSSKTLAVNPAGDLMQVWFSGDTTMIIQSAFKPFGQPWQAPEVVDASNDYSFDGDSLSVGLANCGFAVADWETANQLLVKAALHENLSFPGNGSPTVTHCCSKFAAQEFCVDIIQVAPNPCAAAFNLYCNGVLFATLPNNGANPLTFTIPSCKKSPCTFTVTSVSAFGIESLPVPVTLLPCPCKEHR